jgi:hypothetical protein
MLAYIALAAGAVAAVIARKRTADRSAHDLPLAPHALPATTSAPRSLAQKAARFSLFAPLIVIAIGVLTRGITESSPGFVRVVLLVDLGVLLAGVAAGVAALLGIPRHGASGIVWQALGGVILSAALGAGILMLWDRL